MLGFDLENLLRHNQHRLIYGVPLAENALAFLRSERGKLPDYVKRPHRYCDATGRIAAFWTSSWLSSRLNHTPAVESLAHTPAWKLSEQIPAAAPASATPVLAEISPATDALLEAIAKNKEQYHGQVEFGGETHSFSVKRERSLDDWLHKFCSENAWGGVVESTEPSLELALANHEACPHRVLSAGSSHPVTPSGSGCLNRPLLWLKVRAFALSRFVDQSRSYPVNLWLFR